MIVMHLLVLIFFGISCAAHKNSQVLKNKSLPKEIKLDPATRRIIDSVFVFRNDKPHLETMQLFELKNALLVSAIRQYYKNDTLNQTIKEVFDANGNSIETNTVLHFKNSNQLSKRKFDDAGNLIELISIEDGKTSILETQNIYKGDKLVGVTVISKRTGSILKKTARNYDAKGNLLAELNNSLSVDANNYYWYNAASQVILHKHIRNGSLHDSIVYHYTNGLLDREAWYENPPSSPMVTTYQYNEKNQLTEETDNDFGDTIYYKNYDAFGNWRMREQHTGGKIRRLTRRMFFNQ